MAARGLREPITGLVATGCGVCGAAFPGRWSWQRYCSATCRKVATAREAKAKYAQKTEGYEPPAGTCETCGVIFRRARQRGRHRQWCSAECKRRGRVARARERAKGRAARRRGEARACDECGGMYRPWGRCDGEGFCSRGCATRRQMRAQGEGLGIRRRAPQYRVCAVCGWGVPVGKARICGAVECRRRHEGRKVGIRVCPDCGTSFDPAAGAKWRQVFCSRRCTRRYYHSARVGTTYPSDFQELYRGTSSMEEIAEYMRGLAALKAANREIHRQWAGGEGPSGAGRVRTRSWPRERPPLYGKPGRSRPGGGRHGS
jgi:hypothetical protein